MTDCLVIADSSEILVDIEPGSFLAKRLKVFIGDKEITGKVTRAVFILNAGILE